MEIVGDDRSDVIRKRARSGEEARRLEHEAEVLRAVAHPGVVQLLGIAGNGCVVELVLRRAGGGDLAGLRDPPAAVVAGLGAALATTVADLHDLGVSHRTIQAAHVLLDNEGRPVLCSFGQAVRDPPGAQAEYGRREDIRALAGVLSQLLPSDAPAHISRVLRVAIGAGRAHRSADARWLAKQLASVPAARLPDARRGVADGPAVTPSPADAGTDPRLGPAVMASPDRSDPAPRANPRPRGTVLATLCLLGVVGAVITTLVNRPGQHSPFGRPTLCPAVDAGCVPVAAPGGAFATANGRYQVGQPGDVIVLGRWRCQAVAQPAVLRPTSGVVWVFDSWPTSNQPSAGRVAARVQSARSLRVRPQLSGCDRLEVERQGLPAVTVRGPLP
jgi:hypothetical protein